MLGSSIFHGLVTFFVHLAEKTQHYPALSAVMVRAFTSITMSGTYIVLNYAAIKRVSLSRRGLTLLTFRGLAGGLSAYLSFMALARLPVGMAVTIFYASPAFTAIVSALILHDHPLTLPLCLTIAANFLGIALVSRPTAEDVNTDGVLYALGMAVSATTVFVLQRAMGKRVHFVLGVLSYGLGCALMALVLGSVDDVKQVFLNKWGTVFALCSGFAGFFSQSFLNKGLQYAPAGPAIVVRSLNVPFTFALGLVFLGEKPSAVSAAGVVIVLASVVTIGLQKAKAKELQERALIMAAHHDDDDGDGGGSRV